MKKSGLLLVGAGVFSGMLLVFLLGGSMLKESRPTRAPRVDWMPSFPLKKRVRLMIVGDTGKPGPQRRELRRVLVSEKKDYVLAVGDLVYPKGPKCKDGRASGRALKILDERLGAILGGLGAPVFLVLGNHDVGHWSRDLLREACLLDYASLKADLIMPDRWYIVRLGFLWIVVINTNALSDDDGRRISRALRGFHGQTIFAGHHVIKTYFDKEREDVVLPWLRRHGLKPSLYVNGHAHLLQFGVYKGIPSLTSGSGSKLRRRPSCPKHCGKGQLWGRSVPGFALVDVEADKIEVQFKDAKGRKLWGWSTKKRKRSVRAKSKRKGRSTSGSK